MPLGQHFFHFDVSAKMLSCVIKLIVKRHIRLTPSQIITYGITRREGLSKRTQQADFGRLNESLTQGKGRMTARVKGKSGAELWESLGDTLRATGPLGSLRFDLTFYNHVALHLEHLMPGVQRRVM